MPTTDSSSVSAFASVSRSILSFRRDHAHQMDSGAGAEQQDWPLLDFQRCVADLLYDLSTADGFLSIAWLRRLLETFILCHEEFRALLLDRRTLVASLPLDRLVEDYTDRAIKALDICNAARDGIDHLRRWRNHLDIAVAALRPAAAINAGQLRRARKALAELGVLMLDSKDAGVSANAHRNRSFSRSTGSASRLSNFRSLSWGVTRSWSASRQLQAIGSNVVAPRAHEVAATEGLAVPLYTMSAVLLFTMWSLVAAIPCQDRGLGTHFSFPRSFPWAEPITSLQERIIEESKRKGKKSSAGLLKEIQQIERCVHQLTELMENVKLPITEVEEIEMRQKAEELAQICDTIKEGLDPLERQVREIFLRIVRSRSEGLNRRSSAQREADN